MILANNLQEDVLTYWREHFSFDAIQLITNTHLEQVTRNNDTTVGVLHININGNDGFMCDKFKSIDQHAADLLCQSLDFKLGAETGGWFNRSKFF